MEGDKKERMRERQRGKQHKKKASTHQSFCFGVLFAEQNQNEKKAVKRVAEDL